MIRALLVALVLLTATPAPAHAGPVVALVQFLTLELLVVTGIGAALAPSAAAVAAFANLAVFGGLTAYMLAGQRRLGPAIVSQPEQKGSIKQDIPPHRWWLGDNRGGGVVFFYQGVPPYLYLGLIHSALPMAEYTGAYIGETALVFDGFPDGEIIAPLPVVDQPSYNTRLEVCFQHGALDQPTNPLIARDFPDLDRRLPGIANSVWRFDYGANFEEFEKLWGRVAIPLIEITGRGCPLPDPRRPGHILDFDPRDMAQLYAAIASWAYSNNATRAQAFWAMMPFGLNAGPQAIRWPEAKAAIDFDDESVPLKLAEGETVRRHQPRHTVDGIFTAEERPLDVMEAMLLANGGFVSPRVGQVLLSSSQPREPIFTIGDADIIGDFSYRDSAPRGELANKMTARFIAPEGRDRDGETSWPSEEAAAALAAIDGEPLQQTVRLGVVTTHQRAQRLLKGYQSRARLGRRFAVLCEPRLFGVTEGMVGRVSLTRSFPSANGLYEVEQWVMADDFSAVAFVLVEYDPAIARDWNAETDELPWVPPPEDEE